MMFQYSSTTTRVYCNRALEACALYTIDTTRTRTTVTVTVTVVSELEPADNRTCSRTMVPVPYYEYIPRQVEETLEVIHNLVILYHHRN